MARGGHCTPRGSGAAEGTSSPEAGEAEGGALGSEAGCDGLVCTSLWAGQALKPTLGTGRHWAPLDSGGSWLGPWLRRSLGTASCSEAAGGPLCVHIKAAPGPGCTRPLSTSESPPVGSEPEGLARGALVGVLDQL